MRGTGNVFLNPVSGREEYCKGQKNSRDEHVSQRLVQLMDFFFF